MTQDIPKDVQVETKPETAKELDTTQAEAVGGGTDICNPVELTDGLRQAYDNLVDTASYVMERVITATKAL
jgi:hypothetical protein